MEELLLRFPLIIQVVNYALYVLTKTLSLKASTPLVNIDSIFKKVFCLPD